MIDRPAGVSKVLTAFPRYIGRRPFLIAVVVVVVVVIVVVVVVDDVVVVVTVVVLVVIRCDLPSLSGICPPVKPSTNFFSRNLDYSGCKCCFGLQESVFVDRSVTNSSE